jgi:hypothetical protein
VLGRSGAEAKGIAEVGEERAREPSRGFHPRHRLGSGRLQGRNQSSTVGSVDTCWILRGSDYYYSPSTPQVMSDLLQFTLHERIAPVLANPPGLEADGNEYDGESETDDSLHASSLPTLSSS